MLPKQKLINNYNMARTHLTSTTAQTFCFSSLQLKGPPCKDSIPNRRTPALHGGPFQLYQI